jgi:hypothetical protein
MFFLMRDVVRLLPTGGHGYGQKVRKFEFSCDKMPNIKDFVKYAAPKIAPPQTAAWHASPIALYPASQCSDEAISHSTLHIYT